MLVSNSPSVWYFESKTPVKIYVKELIHGVDTIIYILIGKEHIYANKN